jgi:hypothetical protein
VAADEGFVEIENDGFFVRGGWWQLEFELSIGLIVLAAALLLEPRTFNR